MPQGDKSEYTEECKDGYNAPRVLLVEDNHIAMRVAESIVSSAKCLVQSASDGEQALSLAQSNDFDLVITDLGLPGISGYDFTRQLRAWEMARNKKPMPIVGLTAHLELNTQTTCLQSGMNDVFSKPITLNMMQKILTNYLSTTEPQTDLVRGIIKL